MNVQRMVGIEKGLMEKYSFVESDLCLEIVVKDYLAGSHNNEAVTPL